MPAKNPFAFLNEFVWFNWRNSLTITNEGNRSIFQHLEMVLPNIVSTWNPCIQALLATLCHCEWEYVVVCQLAWLDRPIAFGGRSSLSARIWWILNNESSNNTPRDSSCKALLNIKPMLNWQIKRATNWKQQKKTSIYTYVRNCVLQPNGLHNETHFGSQPDIWSICVWQAC